MGAPNKLSHSGGFVGKPNMLEAEALGGATSKCNSSVVDRDLANYKIPGVSSCPIFSNSDILLAMIAGAHVLLYSKDPETDRAFFRNVLEFPSIDLGEGWLLFALPPAELAVHPGEGQFVHMHAEHSMLGAVLYLMCDDLRSEIGRLENKGAACAKPVEAGWGISTSVQLPRGGEIGLYQPTHPTVIGARSS